MAALITLINALKPILNKKAKEIDELRTKVEGNKPPLKINVYPIEGSTAATYTPTFSEIETAYNEGRELIAVIHLLEDNGVAYAPLYYKEDSEILHGTGYLFTYINNSVNAIMLVQNGALIFKLSTEDERIGNLSSMETDHKGSVVSAINELVYRVERLEGNA